MHPRGWSRKRPSGDRTPRRDCCARSRHWLYPRLLALPGRREGSPGPVLCRLRGRPWRTADEEALRAQVARRRHEEASEAAQWKRELACARSQLDALGAEHVAIEQYCTGLSFVIPWQTLGVLSGAILLATLLMTALPTWQASRIVPAEALRYDG